MGPLTNVQQDFYESSLPVFRQLGTSPADDPDVLCVVSQGKPSAFHEDSRRSRVKASVDMVEPILNDADWFLAADGLESSMA